MPETSTHHEGENFVAPDESQRVEDPEKAAAMAHASKSDRDRASKHRKLLEREHSFGKHEHSFGERAMARIKAGGADEDAEGKEERTGWFFDEQQEIQYMDKFAVEARLKKNQAELQEAKKHEEIQRLKSAIRADKARILELENLLPDYLVEN